jgi:hypothetical protein
MVAAASVVPTAPESNSGPAAIRDYLTKHHAALGLSTVLTGAAALCLMGPPRQCARRGLAAARRPMGSRLGAAEQAEQRDR